MVSFLAKVKFFRFWPKTMDYNKAFLPKSRRFSVVLLLHSGRCYEAEICTILFVLRCPFIWYHFFCQSQNFRFWTKTMDYNKAFLPKSRCFSAVLLLHSGRGYKAEICTILFLLRCPFILWYPFWPKSKFSDFGRKPWTVVHGFDFASPKKVLRKGYHRKWHLKGNRMVQISAL